MKNTKYIVLILITFLFISCDSGSKFSSKSTKDFLVSKGTVEKELSSKEKDKLELALGLVSMDAMHKKMFQSEQYKDKTVEDLIYTAIDGKTYQGVIKLAEIYVENDTELELETLKSKLKDLEKEKQANSLVLEKLNQLKIVDIKINKIEIFTAQPELEIILKNTSDFEIINGELRIEFFSISQNKKVFQTKKHFKLAEGVYLKKGDSITEKKSLTYFFDTSKRLRNEFNKASFPIADFSKLDLKIQITPIYFVTKAGVSYTYPSKTNALIDTEIIALKNKLATTKNIAKDIVKWAELHKSKEEIRYSDKYKDTLAKIRNKRKAIADKTQLIKVDKQVSLLFPKKYDIKKRRFQGTSIMRLSDSLTFNNSNGNLIAYQIKDTLYKEYKFDYAKGQLGLLNKNVIFDFKKMIQEASNDPNLVDFDDFGYITRIIDSYKLLRYFRIKDTHYLYTMSFDNLEECVNEFDRSKLMIAK